MREAFSYEHYADSKIEVQKSDDDDHQRRVRYNGACITTNFAETGEKFLKIPDVIVIFISRFDLFKEGKTTYHVERRIRETGTSVENGFTEIYVNASVDDGSKIAKLMDIFTNIGKYDFELFPKTSERKWQFKNPEKGDSVMCELIEQFAKEYADKCVEEYENKTIVERVDNCAQYFKVSLKNACLALGVEYSEYETARKKTGRAV